MDNSVSSSFRRSSDRQREKTENEHMGMGEGGPSHGGKSLSGIGEAQRQVQAQPTMTYSRGTRAPVEDTLHDTRGLCIRHVQTLVGLVVKVVHRLPLS